MCHNIRIANLSAGKKLISRNFRKRKKKISVKNKNLSCDPDNILIATMIDGKEYYLENVHKFPVSYECFRK